MAQAQPAPFNGLRTSNRAIPLDLVPEALLDPRPIVPADREDPTFQGLMEQLLVVIGQRVLGGPVPRLQRIPNLERDELYVLHFNVPPNGVCPQRAIFRIPRDLRFYRDVKVQSEVDTMCMIKEDRNTQIPLPTIYAYSTGARFLPTGFILMEHIDVGKPFYKVWLTLGPEEQSRTINQYARIVTDLARTRFPLIGSIHKNISGLYETQQFYADKAQPPPAMRGPDWEDAQRTLSFNSSVAWLTDIEAAEQTDLYHYWTDATRKAQFFTWVPKTHWRNVVDAGERTYGARFFRCIPNVVYEASHYAQNLDLNLDAHFGLYNPNMHGDNLLLAPDGSITSILRWENSCTVPLWRVAGIPRFCLMNGMNERWREEYVQDWSTQFLNALQAIAQEPRAWQGATTLRNFSDERFNQLREVASIAVQPWYHWRARMQWLERYEDRYA